MPKKVKHVHGCTVLLCFIGTPMFVHKQRKSFNAFEHALLFGGPTNEKSSKICTKPEH